MFSNNIPVIFTLMASCCSTVLTACMGIKGTNRTNSNLPANFPCQWLDGIIPFAYDFYAINSNRLLKIIRQGQMLIQNRSCLTFNERNPVTLAGTAKSYYYLYYTYSNALENCCMAPIEPGFGRRVVLITPGCKEPHEIAHVTLHMLGLSHGSRSSFPASAVAAVLNLESCQKNSVTRSLSVETSQENAGSE